MNERPTVDLEMAGRSSAPSKVPKPLAESAGGLVVRGGLPGASSAGELCLSASESVIALLCYAPASCEGRSEKYSVQ